MGNLVTASMNTMPLIVTAGLQTREMLLMGPWLSNVDAAPFPRPHGKWSYEPVRPQDASAALMRAYAADRIRELIQQQGATPNIPPKSTSH